MFPSSYGVLFKTPNSYQPPEDTTALASNTYYPNLNSRDYAKRPHNRQLRIHPAWECVAVNVDGTYALATNKLTGREWSSSLWGFERREHIGVEKKSIYKLQCHSLISAMHFVAKNILLISFHSGCVQLWSTRTEVRSINPYCLFMIGERYEHTHPILCLEKFNADPNKAITGGKDCMLKIWDMGKAELTSVNTLRHAHSDVITGIATSLSQPNIFATCSLDKCTLLWDDRQARPATAIYDNHTDCFKACAWATNAISPDEKIIHLGDEDGKILTCDIRKPNEYIEQFTYNDKPVRKIIPRGSRLAVIGDSNNVKAFDGDVQIYESSEPRNFVRDGLWTTDDEFFTIGFDGQLRTHVIAAPHRCGQCDECVANLEKKQQQQQQPFNLPNEKP